MSYAKRASAMGRAHLARKTRKSLPPETIQEAMYRAASEKLGQEYLAKRMAEKADGSGEPVVKENESGDEVVDEGLGSPVDGVDGVARADGTEHIPEVGGEGI